MKMPETTSGPRIGLALGGGAARGLAHIPMLEVFDEMGIRPAVIAGCSFGALVGAAYASGIPAKEIGDHARHILANRVQAAKYLFGV
jgi:NTE family protein